jgi:hypothetical protein
MPQFIEKIRIPVQVAQPAEEPVSGYLSLAPRAQYHDGPETLLELLNTPRRVLPFVSQQGESTRLLHREAIEWVMAGPDAPAGLVAPHTFRVTREERVQVCFRDGRSVEGVLRMELPDDLNRASDFLNTPEDFFPLTSGVRTLLISKAAVREVRLFSESPRPVGSGGSES